MDELAKLKSDVDMLRERMLNMRADLFAYRLTLHASFIAMSAPARAALLHNVQHLGEQAMSMGLATSQSKDDSTVHAMQAALDRVLVALEQLPHS